MEKRIVSYFCEAPLITNRTLNAQIVGGMGGSVSDTVREMEGERERILQRKIREGHRAGKQGHTGLRETKSVQNIFVQLSS